MNQLNEAVYDLAKQESPSKELTYLAADQVDDPIYGRAEDTYASANELKEEDEEEESYYALATQGSQKVTSSIRNKAQSSS